jgi:DNA-binding NarL/FixJ family response regulator
MADLAANATSILIVDDDDGYRALVATSLAEAGYETLEAPDGRAGLLLAREHALALALLDINLPLLNGYELYWRIRSEQPNLAIAFMSGERIESYDRVAGLLLGADDYFVKPTDTAELLARVRALVRRSRSVSRESRSTRPLTPREQEILQLLSEGVTQKEIALKLVISDKTVATHIQRILGKLGVHSRSHAVALAIRERLVTTYH